jgi:hypothetical protein
MEGVWLQDTPAVNTGRGGTHFHQHHREPGTRPRMFRIVCSRTLIKSVVLESGRCRLWHCPTSRCPPTTDKQPSASPGRSTLIRSCRPWRADRAPPGGGEAASLRPTDGLPDTGDCRRCYVVLRPWRRFVSALGWAFPRLPRGKLRSVAATADTLGLRAFAVVGTKLATLRGLALARPKPCCGCGQRGRRGFCAASF